MRCSCCNKLLLNTDSEMCGECTSVIRRCVMELRSKSNVIPKEYQFLGLKTGLTNRVRVE